MVVVLDACHVRYLGGTRTDTSPKLLNSFAPFFLLTSTVASFMATKSFTVTHTQPLWCQPGLVQLQPQPPCVTTTGCTSQHFSVRTPVMMVQITTLLFVSRTAYVALLTSVWSARHDMLVKVAMPQC